MTLARQEAANLPPASEQKKGTDEKSRPFPPAVALDKSKTLAPETFMPEARKDLPPFMPEKEEFAPRNTKAFAQRSIRLDQARFILVARRTAAFTWETRGG